MISRHKRITSAVPPASASRPTQALSRQPGASTPWPSAPRTQAAGRAPAVPAPRTVVELLRVHLPVEPASALAVLAGVERMPPQGQQPEDGDDGDDQ